MRGSAYSSWWAMHVRCLYRGNSAYYLYGGRGIKVCERWLGSFENFLTDMGERPAGLSLDRIDPNGHYEPSNCRWADKKTQATNRRPRGEWVPRPKQAADAATETLNEVRAWVMYQKSNGRTYKGIASALSVSRDKLWHILNQAKTIDGDTYRRFRELQ